ncbi:MAG: hypothetical protein HON23_06480 [Rickettsiales bacterium]|nr:hypothetical protein [Rickettsiales bacterium]
MNNLEKYKADLDQLIKDGKHLLLSIESEISPSQVKRELGDEQYDRFVDCEIHLETHYQAWYSEALFIIELLLPNRADNFRQLYEANKSRKYINYENYRIYDYLLGFTVSSKSNSLEEVSEEAVFPLLIQQVEMLKSCTRKFDSSLFNIRNLIQSDLFDSEIDAAKDLNKKGFTRGAGAMAGVVLEHHLAQICENHQIKISRKTPTINDYNEALKKDNVIELPKSRHIQTLGDLRNLCSHKKDQDPTKDDVDELISGVTKIIKTVF